MACISCPDADAILRRECLADSPTCHAHVHDTLSTADNLTTYACK